MTKFDEFVNAAVKNATADIYQRRLLFLGLSEFGFTDRGTFFQLDPEKQSMIVKFLLDSGKLQTKMEGSIRPLLEQVIAPLYRNSSIVRLNVGGKRFYTTRDTLLGFAPNFFHRLLSEPLLATFDEKGCIFIDRSPRIFEDVLHYLRTGDLLIDSPIVLQEMRFYGLDIPTERSLALTDARLLSLVSEAKVSLLKERHSAITALLSDIGPRLIAGVNRLGQTLDQPVIIVKVFPGVNEFATAKHLFLKRQDFTPWDRALIVENRQSVYSAMLEWQQQSDEMILCSDPHYALLMGLAYQAERAFTHVIKEMFQLTLTLEVPDDSGMFVASSSSPGAFTVVKRSDEAYQYASGVPASAESVIPGCIPCVHLTWSALT